MVQDNSANSGNTITITITSVERNISDGELSLLVKIDR